MGLYHTWQNESFTTGSDLKGHSRWCVEEPMQCWGLNCVCHIQYKHVNPCTISHAWYFRFSRDEKCLHAEGLVIASLTFSFLVWEGASLVVSEVYSWLYDHHLLLMGIIRGPYAVSCIKPRSPEYKACTLPVILFLLSINYSFLKLCRHSSPGLHYRVVLMWSVCTLAGIEGGNGVFTLRSVRHSSYKCRCSKKKKKASPA